MTVVYLTDPSVGSASYLSSLSSGIKDYKYVSLSLLCPRGLTVPVVNKTTGL